MTIIHPSLTENIFPGCGYSYAAMAPLKRAFGGSSEAGDGSSQSERLKMGLSAIPEILMAIKESPETAIKNLVSEDLGPSPAFFESPAQTELFEIINTASLSQLCQFLSLNGPMCLNIISPKPKQLYSKLKDVVFDENHYTFFIKKRNCVLTWNLDQNAAQTPPTEGQVYGDSFVKTLNFGRESVFQINFDKNDFIGISDAKTVIETELTSFLANPKSIPKVLTAKAEITPIKAPKKVESQKWDIRALGDFVSTHAETAQRTPTLIDGALGFYSGPRAPLTRAAVAAFEAQTVPNCVDVFQSSCFLSAICEAPQFYCESEINLSQTLLSAVKHHLTKINTHTVLVHSASKQKHLIAHFPPIPAAADILRPLLHPAAATSAPAALSHAEPALPLRSFSAAPVFPASTAPISFDSFAQLCALLLAESAGFKNLTHMFDSLLPLSFVRVSRTYPDGDDLRLLTPDAAFPAMGLGLLLWRCPSSLAEWAALLRRHGVSRNAFDSSQTLYVIFFELEDGKQLALKNVFAPHLSLHDLSALGPRAVSRFADGQRFFFHPLALPYVIEGNPDIQRERLLDDDQLLQKLKELDGKLKKEKNGIEGTATKIQSELEQIVDFEPPPFASELVRSKTALLQLCEAIERAKPMGEEEGVKTPQKELFKLANEAKNKLMDKELERESLDLASQLDRLNDEVLSAQAAILEIKIRLRYENAVKNEAVLSVARVVEARKVSEYAT